MEPITAGLNLLSKALDFGMLVYQDTPLALRQQNAGDWAMFVHGISTEILALQKQIQQQVKP